MRRSLIIFFAITCISNAFKSYGAVDNVPNSPNIQNNNEDNNIMSNQMIIKIGSYTFTATLFDNATADAFKALLPITVTMSELNGNEKYFYLSSNSPTNASNPGTINTGDLMIWGSNCLVLFYKTFSTSYSYTKLGRIDDTSGLAAAVGSGDVTVTFELASTTGIQKDVPIGFVLEQNYPNPFNPVTTIKFSIPEISKGDDLLVQLKVYDSLGQEIATLVNERKTAGYYEVRFDGSNLSSGIYFYEIKAGNYSDIKKFVLLK